MRPYLERNAPPPTPDAERALVFGADILWGVTPNKHVITLLALARSLCGAPLLGCSGPQERPACSPQALAALEAERVAEAVRRCEGYPDYESCPDHDALELKYDALREAWVDCR